jgi:hypothetical protein
MRSTGSPVSHIVSLENDSWTSRAGFFPLAVGVQGVKGGGWSKKRGRPSFRARRHSNVSGRRLEEILPQQACPLGSRELKDCGHRGNRHLGAMNRHVGTIRAIADLDESRGILKSAFS